MTGEGDRLPMFPLGSVLVPHAALSLHIFEPRYRVLVFDCLRAQREFGIVLIERGFEVGGHDQRFAVGTVAALTEAAELPDGRWLVNAVGRRRIGVSEWLPDDPYPVAWVHDLTDGMWSPAADDALVLAERAVRVALGLASGAGENGLELPDDPAVAAWHLVAGAPVGALDKQGLLALDDPAERLQRLAALAEEQTILLKYRLDQE